jgi:alanine dehydrogenase
LFTYLHLASNQPLTESLLQSKTTGIAYETVQTASGTLPLLTPMSDKEMAARKMILELEAELIAAGEFTGVNAMAIGEDEIAEMAKLDTVMQHFKQIAEKQK